MRASGRRQGREAGRVTLRGNGSGMAGGEQIAVIGDVHADWPALSTVAEQITGLGIDRIVCLGDWVSGGPDPVACFDWVTSRCEVVLAGNHELFVLGRIWRQETASWAQAAHDASDALGAARIARLRDFDAYARLPYAELVHGALTGPISDLITTPTAGRAEPPPARRGRPALHPTPTTPPTGTPPDGAQRPRQRRPRPGAQIALDPEDRVLLNPGAVTADRRWLKLTLTNTRPTIATWHQAPATDAA